MSQTSLFSDEESSNNDVLCELYSEMNLKMNDEFQNKKNGIFFENEFKNIFNENNNILLLEYEKKNKQTLYERKIFKSITPNIIQKDLNDNFFPFSRGIGLNKCLEKIGYIANYISPFEVNLSTIKDEDKIFNTNNKFKIIDYSQNEKGKIKKIKKKRKYKPDDIRKKIKARFHKAIKNIININLKNAGSKKLFDFMPQYFISNVSIKLNNIVLNYTYEELIKTDIAYDILKQNKSDTDLEKYNRNLDVLNYLNNNPEICQISIFNKIKNMKYSEILNAYFLSKEFEESIFELHKKREKIEYIEEYINKALNYVIFFSTKGTHKQSTNDSDYKNSNDQ